MRLTIVLAAVCGALLLAAPANAAPNWLGAVELGAESADQSTGQVALGANGTAVAAWAQGGGGTTVLQVARRAPGAGFGAPVTVPGTTGAGNVRVGVDSTGNATILYGIGTALAVMSWPAGAAAPGGAQTLAAGISPVLAVGRGGSAVAAWIDNASATAFQVRAAARDGAGGSFGPGNVISFLGNNPDQFTGLRAAVGDSGHAAVIWSRTNGVAQRIVEVNDRAPGGSFALNGTSLSSAVGSQLEPAIAVGADGRLTALWRNNSVVKVADRPPGGSWSSEDQASPPAVPANAPVTAAGPNGLVVAAWQAGGRIQTATSTNATRSAASPTSLDRA